MPLPRVHELAYAEGLPAHRALRILQDAGFFVRSASSTLSPHEVDALKTAIKQAGPGTKELWATELAAAIRSGRGVPGRRPGAPRPMTTTPAPAQASPPPAQIVAPPRPRRASPQINAEDEPLLAYLRSGATTRPAGAKLTRQEAETQLFGGAPRPPTQPSRSTFEQVQASDRRRATRAAELKERRRCEKWRPWGFDDEASRAWTEGGLDVDKPDVAAAARTAGIGPDDLRTRVHGSRVAARLNGGESAVAVRARLIEDAARPK